MRIAALVERFHQLADLAHWQFDAAAGLHPGHAQHARLGADGLADIAEHFIHRSQVGVLEQRHAAYLGAHHPFAVVKPGIGGVVLVGADQNLLARRYLQATVDHRQAICGAAGQGYLAWLHAEIPAGPGAHIVFIPPEFLAVPVDHFPGVLVQACAKVGDGVAHHTGVRGEKEVTEVQVGRVQVELLAQGLPLVLGRLCQRLCGLGNRAEAGRQGQAGGEQAGLLQEITAVVHQPRPACAWPAAPGLPRRCTASHTRRKLPPHSLAMSASE